jgi:hypothetical protein
MDQRMPVAESYVVQTTQKAVDILHIQWYSVINEVFIE